MSSGYTEYHPRWFRRRMPIFWWIRKRAYVLFIGRELTSLAVLYSALLLLALTWSLARGPEAYERFTALMGRGPIVALNSLALVALILHSITWLSLAPKALVVRLGSRRVPDALVILGHYAAWLLTSALVAWLLIGG